MARRERFQTRHGRHRDVNRLLRRSTFTPENERGMNEEFVEEQALRLSVTPEELHGALMLVQGDEQRFSFEDVEAATEASDIGLAPPFDVATESLNFTGAAYLANTSIQAYDFADAWTIAFAFKVDTFTVNKELFQFASAPSGDSFSNIGVFQGGTAGIRAILTAASGPPASNTKFYTWDNIVTNGAWHLLVLRWDGTNFTLSMDGVLDIATTSILNDDSITMGDTPRQLHIWADRTADPSNAGNLLYMGVWDSKLADAEVTAITNGGLYGDFNLEADSGDYVSSANLKRLWIPCREDTDIGADYGKASSPIDVFTNAVNVSAANCEADVPAI